MRTEDLHKELVQLYPHLLHYGLLLTGARSDAEDVVHEAMVRCLRRASRVEVRHLGGFMRKLVTNEYLRMKTRQRRSSVPIDARLELARGADYVIDLRGEVAYLLALLTPRERAVILCRYYLDLTEAASAEALGCSNGTVKKLHFRAMRKMRAVEPVELVEHARTGVS